MSIGGAACARKNSAFRPRRSSNGWATAIAKSTNTRQDHVQRPDPLRPRAGGVVGHQVIGRRANKRRVAPRQFVLALDHEMLLEIRPQIRFVVVPVDLMGLLVEGEGADHRIVR